MQGAKERRDRAWDLAAWTTAHLLTALGRRYVTPSSLLGRPLTGVLEEQTPEQRAANFGAVWEKYQQLGAEGRLLPAGGTE